MTSTVNRIFFRRSGTLNMFFKLESVLIMRAPGVATLNLPVQGRSRRSRTKKTAPPSTVGEGVAFRRRPAPAERGGQHFDAAACSLDGLDGGAGEGVGGHRHPAGELAPTEDLDQAVLVDQTGGPEALGRDGAAVAVDRFDGVEVDDDVLDPERVLESLQLRDPLRQRELATLEPRLDVVPCALALGAAPSGLAALAADAAPDPSPGPRGPRRRMQIMYFHCFPPRTGPQPRPPRQGRGPLPRPAPSRCPPRTGARRAGTGPVPPRAPPR